MFQSINKPENQSNNSENFWVLKIYPYWQHIHCFQQQLYNAPLSAKYFLSVADKHFNSLTIQLTGESFNQVGTLIQNFRFNLNLFKVNPLVIRLTGFWSVGTCLNFTDTYNLEFLSFLSNPISFRRLGTKIFLRFALVDSNQAKTIWTSTAIYKFLMSSRQNTSQTLFKHFST